MSWSSLKIGKILKEKVPLLNPLLMNQNTFFLDRDELFIFRGYILKGIGDGNTQVNLGSKLARFTDVKIVRNLVIYFILNTLTGA